MKVGREAGGDDDYEGRRPSTEGVLALMALGLLLMAGFLQLSPATSNAIASEITGFLSSSQTTASANSSVASLTVYSPVITNGAADVSYPADYETLAAFAVSLINTDRANQSASAVSLGTNQAAQQHADSMLKYDYFSHYDTQGFKPYMRYTLLGGVGAVTENLAFITWPSNHFNSLASLEGSISVLEHGMMYNDSACCNNGHRLNIVNPLHNRVAIGLAYNSTSLFFVEDFENYYANLSYNVSSSYQFSMNGNFTAPVAKPSQIYVTFDSKPSAETPEQLDAGPKDYDPGYLLGGVLPPCDDTCPALETGATVHASVWVITPESLEISFDLSPFIRAYGTGVYTVYLLTGADTGSALTSISIFVS
jgi:hypothetical protein